jgi:hypothetical protein
MESEVYKRKVDTRDELLNYILDAVGSIKKSADQGRQTTRVLRTRVAKYRDVEGGICENLL